MTTPTREQARQHVVTATGETLMPVLPGYSVVVLDAPLEVELFVQNADGSERRIWPTAEPT